MYVYTNNNDWSSHQDWEREKERDCGKDRQAESEILSNGGIMRGMMYIFYKMHGLSVVPRNRNKF